MFADIEGCEEVDVPPIGKKLPALPNTVNKPRMVVITQGAVLNIFCVGGDVREYSIIDLSKDKHVNFNVAGGAYVRGFLSGLVPKKSALCAAEVSRVRHCPLVFSAPVDSCTFSLRDEGLIGTRLHGSSIVSAR